MKTSLPPFNKICLFQALNCDATLSFISLNAFFFPFPTIIGNPRYFSRLVVACIPYMLFTFSFVIVLVFLLNISADFSKLIFCPKLSSYVRSTYFTISLSLRLAFTKSRLSLAKNKRVTSGPILLAFVPLINPSL